MKTIQILAIVTAIVLFNSACDQQAPKKPQQVKHLIDTHIHLYDTNRDISMRWPPKSDAVLYQPHLPQEYNQKAKAAGVTGVVIVEASDHLEDNDWMLKLVKDDPFYLGLVGNVDVYREDFEQQITRLKQDSRFVGIRPRGVKKIDYTDPLVLKNLRILAKHGLTMDYLTNGGGIAGIETIDQVAKQVPDLTIVVNHCLGYKFDGKVPSEDWVRAVATLAKNEKVYCKISGLYQLSVLQPAPQVVTHFQSVLEVIWNQFGSKRVMYGSNWPVTKHSGDYQSYSQLIEKYISSKGQPARELFYWGNAVTAYRLPLK